MGIVEFFDGFEFEDDVVFHGEVGNVITYT